MSKKGQRNGISVSLKSHTKSSSEESRKILFWRMKSPRTPGMKSSTSYYWWKFNSEKIILDWARHGDPTFSMCIDGVTAWAWISKTTITGSQSEQAQAQRESIFVQRIEDEGPSSSRMLCKKLPRNWRIENTLLSGRKYWKTTKVGRHFYAAWSGITKSESILTILTYWAVMTYLRSSSSSYYFEFKKAQLRSWNAAKYTREYEHSWKRFWLSTCSTRSWCNSYNYSRNLATPSGIADDVEDS